LKGLIERESDLPTNVDEWVGEEKEMRMRTDDGQKPQSRGDELEQATD
jgi:hypothetical protein